MKYLLLKWFLKIKRRFFIKTFFKPKSILKFGGLFLFGIFNLTNSWAQDMGPSCSMTKNANFNFYISLSQQKIGMFGDTGDRTPPVIVHNCKSASGKQLGFGLALRYSYLSSDTALVSYDGTIHPEVCKIDNAPVPLAPFEEKQAYFQKQFQFLRACTYLEVSSLNQIPLHYKSDQKNCKLTPISPTKIKAEGNFCFLPIFGNTEVILSIVIRPECSNLSFLKNLKISPTDMESFLQVFVVDDDQGDYINNMIGVAKSRIVLLPPENSIPVSQDPPPEEPRFPNQFSTDIHWGEIKIKDAGNFQDQKSFIEFSLFVDHRSPCKEQYCASSSDYQQPLAGEMELTEWGPISNKSEAHPLGSKKIDADHSVDERVKSLDSFIAGNPFDPFVRAQWQGLFQFGRNTVEAHLVPGKRYELNLSFYNPYDDYIILMKRKEQLLVDLTLMNGTAGKDSIRPISPLFGFLGLPLIPPMPALGSEDISVELEKVRQFFRRLGSDLSYPPYYESICSTNPLKDGDHTKCKGLKNLSKYLVLKVQFTLGEKNEEGFYNLKDIVQIKQSPIFQSYVKTHQSLPKIVCP